MCYPCSLQPETVSKSFHFNFQFLIIISLLISFHPPEWNTKQAKCLNFRASHSMDKHSSVWLTLFQLIPTQLGVCISPPEMCVPIPINRSGKLCDILHPHHPHTHHHESQSSFNYFYQRSNYNEQTLAWIAIHPFFYGILLCEAFFMKTYSNWYWFSHISLCHCFPRYLSTQPNTPFSATHSDCHSLCSRSMLWLFCWLKKKRECERHYTPAL